MDGHKAGHRTPRSTHNQQSSAFKDSPGLSRTLMIVKDRWGPTRINRSNQTTALVPPVSLKPPRHSPPKRETNLDVHRYSLPVIHVFDDGNY